MEEKHINKLDVFVLCFTVGVFSTIVFIGLFLVGVFFFVKTVTFHNMNYWKEV